jgi:hypothetical protein
VHLRRFTRTSVKKSSTVAAPLLASAALAMLTACRQPEMQRCVDEHNVVVDDSLCAAQPQHNPAGGFYPSPFRYYYGGYGGYGLGSMVGGGGYAPMAGHSYASSTTRGGFGSTHAGGGGADE